MKKFLIIRFSSIGDIVLTIPVVRCIKKQIPDAEIHFLTKEKFVNINIANPYLSKVIGFHSSLNEVIGLLRKEKYDRIIDLHNNLRSLQIKMLLACSSSTFSKLNFKKWLLTNFKVNKLPDVHIVERYMDTVKSLGVSYDGKGLDYFIPDTEEVDIQEEFPDLNENFVSFSIGGAHKTKQIPSHKLIEIVKEISLPIVLLGGKEDIELADKVINNIEKKVWNACGKLSLHQSASVINQSKAVITTDTGLMHIAAAFKKRIVSVWGNTVPAFGMYPFLSDGLERFSEVIEVKDLKCRPCSKIGFKKCPKTHFKCMEDISVEDIVQAVSYAANTRNQNAI